MAFAEATAGQIEDELIAWNGYSEPIERIGLAQDRAKDSFVTQIVVWGRNHAVVDEEAWQSLCARCGYLQNRQNPRGF